MKLPIKKEWLKKIKNGEKKVEYRDAHITFVCEETGEEITKSVLEVGLVGLNEGPEEAIKDGYLSEKDLICFWLGNKPNRKIKIKKKKVSKYKDYMETLNEELEHYKITRIPRCSTCKKEFEKIERKSGKTYSTWKPACGCITKDIRLCIG